MAQVKLLKIAAIGLPQQNEAADDITFASMTASLAGGLNVTSGVSITNNISFNAVTDTIAGIQNQNLLDKSAAESISGVFDYTSLPTSSVAPTSGTELTNKDYVDGLVNGIHWQEPVLDIQVDATLDPGASPTTGDRYIVTDTGALNANFGTITGVGNNDIVEYDGANFIVAWDASVEGEGGAAYVGDVDKNYVFNGTAWVTFGSTVTHNNLSGLQGGNGSTEYYHMTSAEDTWLGTVSTEVAAANVVDKTAAEAISGNWTYTGENDYSGGEFTFPNAVSASPAEGDSYWDGTADILYVWNGTAWQDVGASGAATGVENTYTVGAGGVTAGDALYISANDTVLKADASAIATGKLIGFAKTTEAAAANVEVVKVGVISNITASAGDILYLSTTAGALTTTPPSGAGEIVYKAGYAKSASELDIQLQFIAIR
jgi:hypothetical protein